MKKGERLILKPVAMSLQIASRCKKGSALAYWRKGMAGLNLKLAE